MVARCRAPLEEGGIVGPIHTVPSTTTQLVSPKSADRPLERQVVLCSGDPMPDEKFCSPKEAESAAGARCM